ncbi:hypothetical protein P9272_02335 [Mesorhizobium sp. WSM4976]|uniref:hypothetical protein n=1 Tax=Mesorhizobium sp. WSM4976 TaxID=3038549 RepID=UPI002417C7AB|nr:hypothetical protein [Mesorhizobium sp. WSM4976]MDG4892435.1 hypothetical protein [Mesorhizobium sp. WSM4976]
MRMLNCDNPFLVGTQARVPRVAGSQPLTNIDALELDRVPAHRLCLVAANVGLAISAGLPT